MKSPMKISLLFAVCMVLMLSCKKDKETDGAIAITVVPDSLTVRLSSTENAVDLAFRFTHNGTAYTANVERPFLNTNSNAYMPVLNPVVLPMTANLFVDASRVPNVLTASAVTLPNTFDLTLNAFPDIRGESIKLFNRITFNLALSTKVVFSGQNADFAATYKDSTNLLSAKTSAGFKLFNDSSPDVGGIQRTPSIAYIK
jgi:hypothetical protein